MKLLPLLIGAILLSAGYARASDVNSPAATALKTLQTGYPTKCGWFIGVGIGGSAGAVTTNIQGTQIVQGDLGLNGGYTCPFGTYGFWFVEASGGIANLNAGTTLANTGTGISGLNLNGPAVFMERFAFGSPLNQMLGGLLPSGTNFLTALNAAMPSVPLLPTGVTLSPANIYMFAGVVEADYGASLGLINQHQWMVSPIIGVGNLARASNNVMLDTWAGFQFGSTNSICPGGGSACAKLGNMVRVGTSLKY